MLTTENFSDKFEPETFIDVTFSVRESDDVGWFELSDLIDPSTQLTTPTVAYIDKVVEEKDGQFFNKDGQVFAYEYPKVSITAKVELDSTLETTIRQALKTMVIKIQSKARDQGTKWAIKNKTGLIFKQSDLSKGRVRLQLKDKIKKLTSNDSVTDDDIEELAEYFKALKAERTKAVKK